MLFTVNPRRLEKEKISVMQGYTLWRSLVDRYVTIDHLNHLKNFTHDVDFEVYLTEIIEDVKKESNMLEDLLAKYGMPGPEPNVRDQNTGGNSEIVKDKETAEVLYKFIRLDTIALLLSFKDTYINDDIREVILKLAKNSIKRVNKYIMYLKAKNWVYFPPLYPYTSPKTQESVGLNEVFLLWDHLVFRYSNIRQTQIYYGFVTEEEFAALLNAGIKILQKEARQIEDQLLKFGVTLPKAYSSIPITPENKELLDDKFIYNNIIRGMKDALALHGAAIAEIIVNDELRKFFINLTFKEMDLLDKMMKYGKARGWTLLEPAYKGGG